MISFRKYFLENMSILGTLGTHVVKWYKRPNGNMLINHLSPYIIKVV